MRQLELELVTEHQKLVQREEYWRQRHSEQLQVIFSKEKNQPSGKEVELEQAERLKKVYQQSQE